MVFSTKLQENKKYCLKMGQKSKKEKNGDSGTHKYII